ncbi:MAG: hypothetical protein ACJ8HQ_01900 [Chthoniobacterales bacterium]
MQFRAIAAALLIFGVVNARAVILFDTGDPNANTTAPDGTLAGSGWQYEGIFGGFLGTPIAPRFFLSAKHVGNQGSIVFGTTSYSVIAQFYDPTSDLAINQVAQDLPVIAPIFTSSDETGRRLVVIGRGTQRGDLIMRNGTPRGWSWGAGDARERWGENDVAAIVNFSSGPDDAIYATFDQPSVPGALPNESHLSVGDSSGAVFINDNGTWKVAGINYAVDDVYSAPDPNTGFSAAIFDARDYYNRTGQSTWELITGASPVPTGFYATRISSKLPWIYSVIDPTGDADNNGTPNLLQYALSLNSPASDPARQPTITRSGSNVFFIYRKITNAPNLHYQLEQSTDLAQWLPASSQDSVVSTSENVATIKAQIAMGAKAKAFFRLSITQD